MASVFDNTEYLLELLLEKKLIDDTQVKEAWKTVSSSEGQLNIIDALKKLKYVNDNNVLSVFS